MPLANLVVASDSGVLISVPGARPGRPKLVTYYCNATDARPVIQAAIDAIPVGGGTVRIQGGTYNLSKSPLGAFCLNMKGSNKRILFEPGATLKVLPNQFGSAGDIIQVGNGITLSGLPTPNQIPQETRLSVWGPGTLDGNQANGNALSRGLLGTGNIQWSQIGGGLIIQECGSLPFNWTGVNVGGDPADYHVKNLVIDRLFVRDCSEGVFVTNCRRTSVDHLHIDNIAVQDGFEPLACDELVMTNSVIQNIAGSALDLFSSAGASPTSENHTYLNCIFGPMNVAGSVVAISIGGTLACINISLIGCIIRMNNALRGIFIGDDLGASATTKGVLIGSCIIDGTGGAALSRGIEVGPEADETLIQGNMIRNCIAAAIDVTGNPTSCHLKDNSGWNNGSGISGTPPSDFVNANNTFSP